MPKPKHPDGPDAYISLKLPAWPLSFYSRYLGQPDSHAGYVPMIRSAIDSYVKSGRSLPLFSLWPGECARGRKIHLSKLFTNLGLTPEDFVGRTVKFEKKELERWIDREKPRALPELRLCVPKKHYLLAALDYQVSQVFEEQMNFFLLEQKRRVKSLRSSLGGLKSEIGDSGDDVDLAVLERKLQAVNRASARMKEAKDRAVAATQVIEVLDAWAREDGVNTRDLRVIATLLVAEADRSQGFHNPDLAADFLAAVNTQNDRLAELHLAAIA